MQLTDIFAQLGGMDQVAKELGISPAQASMGAAALVPAILGGMKKQAQAQPAGLDGLAGLLGGLGGGSLLDEVLAPKATNVSRGNDVLGQIFGSKEVSRTVAQGASTQTGLDPALLKKMLPMVAMLVAGYVAKQNMGSNAQPANQGGALGGALGGVLGSVLGGGAGSNAGGLGNVLGGLLGGGRGAPNLAQLLDMTSSKNPLDELLGLAAKLQK